MCSLISLLLQNDGPTPQISISGSIANKHALLILKISEICFYLAKDDGAELLNFCRLLSKQIYLPRSVKAVVRGGSVGLPNRSKSF